MKAAGLTARRAAASGRAHWCDGRLTSTDLALELPARRDRDDPRDDEHVDLRAGERRPTHHLLRRHRARGRRPRLLRPRSATPPS